MTSMFPLGILDSGSANYNAVKIRVNNPIANIPENYKSAEGDNNIYNAVDLEVNNPSLNVQKEAKIYNYPLADELVTYPMLPKPVIIQPLPPVCPDCGLPEHTCDKKNFESTITNKEEIQPVIENDIQDVVAEEIPAPNFTTLKAEKASPEISFHGIAFKGNQKPEIVPPVEILPDVNVKNVVSNLKSPDFDKQALQIEGIAKVAATDPEKLDGYVITEIFNGLIDIVRKDTSDLAKPNEEQNKIRQQYIVNKLVEVEALNNGKNIEEIELPYQISDEEARKAATLTPLEQAERNKEYAIYGLAILARHYADEVKKQQDATVPLTDLPGVSVMVDVLRYNKNSDIRIAAIDGLRYIQRPEYNEELKSVYTLATKDTHPYVVMSAMKALEALEPAKTNEAEK